MDKENMVLDVLNAYRNYTRKPPSDTEQMRYFACLLKMDSIGSSISGLLIMLFVELCMPEKWQKWLTEDQNYPNADMV